MKSYCVKCPAGTYPDKGHNVCVKRRFLELNDMEESISTLIDEHTNEVIDEEDIVEIENEDEEATTQEIEVDVSDEELEAAESVEEESYEELDATELAELKGDQLYEDFEEVEPENEEEAEEYKMDEEDLMDLEEAPETEKAGGKVEPAPAKGAAKGGNNTILYVIVGVVVVILLGVGIFMFMRKKGGDNDAEGGSRVAMLWSKTI